MAKTGRKSSPTQQCPFAEQTKKLVVYDAEGSGNRHYDRKSSLLEIVQTDTTDSLTIHYTGPKPPNPARVTRDGSTLTGITGSERAGGKVYSLDVQYFPKKDPYGRTAHDLLKALFTFAAAPTVYTISGFPQPIRINAYNPDQWKLSFALPPVRGLKMGAVLDNKKSARVETGDRVVATKSHEKSTLKTSFESSNWKQTTSKEVTSTYERHASAIATPKLYAYASHETLSIDAKTSSEPVQAGKLAIALERNRAAVDIDGLDLVLGILSLVANITAAVKAFKEYAPKVGWYIDLELKALEGKVEIAWGWKENSDYRVYYYVGIAANVTLFEITLEIGFGVSVAGVGGQVCVQFKGGLSLQVGVQTVGPGADSLDLGTLAGVIEAGGYVRVTAGDVLRVEGGIKSSITSEAKVSVKFAGGLEVAGEDKWDGLSLVCSAQTMFGWKTSKTMSVMSPQQLGTWKFPGGKPPSPSELQSKIEVSRIVEDVVNEGWNLRVFRENEVVKKSFWSGEPYTAVQSEQLTSAQVADIIADPIWQKRSDLLLDAKTVKGLAHAVRKKCDIIASKDYWRDWMTHQQLIDFLGTAEFTHILEDARDPAKDLKKKVSKSTA